MIHIQFVATIFVLTLISGVVHSADEQAITIIHAGTLLAIPGESPKTRQSIIIEDAFIARLECDLDRLNADLPALQDFILPGGGHAAAACHMARTIVRRAERRVSALKAAEAVRDESLRYLNRLSDLLFVVARVLARVESGQEVIWNRERIHNND